MLFIGIDWADDHHDAAIMDQNGTVLEEFRLTHDQEGFDQLKQRIQHYQQKQGLPADQVLVALETKHGLLVHHLVQSRYGVYVLNPKAVSRYKDRFRAAGNKDDKRDARAMADMLRTDRHLHRPLVLTDDDYRLLERLCQDLQGVISDITRLGNRMQECLKEHYPAVLDTFGMDTDIFFAFVTQYPAPDSLVSLSHREFLLFLKQHQYSVPAKADALFARLTRRTPPADPVAAAAGKMKLKSLVAQLVLLRATRKSYETEIKQLLDKLPEGDIISSLPGVGKRLAPEITALFGPNRPGAPQRFAQARDISNLAGCTPVTKQSGKHRSVQVRYACNKWLRHVTRNWAGASLLCSRWAKAYYEWHRQQGDGHETILRKLAAKWIKITFHLWRLGEHYDEETHIASLQQRDVVWAMGL